MDLSVTAENGSYDGTRSCTIYNGYVNKQNYGEFWSEDQPEELQKLRMHPEIVTAFIREIPAEMLERVISWTKRMDHLKRTCGQHLHEIIIKHQIIWIVLWIQIKISCIILNFMCFF